VRGSSAKTGAAMKVSSREKRIFFIIIA